MNSRVLLGLSFLFAVLAAGPTWAQTQPAQVGVYELEQRLQGKTLLLRTPNQSSRIEVDSAGKLVTAPAPGTWALDSALQVKKMRVRSGRIELDGRRIVQFYRNNKLESVAGNENIRIELALNASDPDSVNHQMAAVFFGGGETQPSAPPPDKTSPNGGNPREIGQLEDGEKIYDGSNGITAPEVLESRDPDYPNYPNNDVVIFKVVIDREGLIHTIAVVRGERDSMLAAAASFRHWRFRPAKLAGQPIAVEVNIEVHHRN